MWLEPADQIEQLLLRRLQEQQFGRYVIRSVVFPQDAGDRMGGQLWRVQVDTKHMMVDDPDSGTKVKPKGVRIAIAAWDCGSAQKDAMRGAGRHVHSADCDAAPGWGLRWWEFDGMSIADVLLIALRWNPVEEWEPFGWVRATGGRERPNGDPTREICEIRESRPTFAPTFAPTSTGGAFVNSRSISVVTRGSSGSGLTIAPGAITYTTD